MQPQAVTACTLMVGGQKAAFPLDYGVQLSLCMVQVAFGVFSALWMGIGRGGWGRQALRSESASAECQMGARTGASLEMGVCQVFALL